MRFFLFNDTATTEIYTLSLHDALPIWPRARRPDRQAVLIPEVEHEEGVSNRLDARRGVARVPQAVGVVVPLVGEIGRAHVELQSRQYLVCGLLLEKKKIFSCLPCSTMH